MVGKFIGEKRLKEMQAEKDLKRKWKGTCSFCYKIFLDNQARDRHMKTHHSDKVIEEDLDTGTVIRNVVEGDDVVEDIKETAAFLLEEILDKVVKKSKNKSGTKCPECDKVFSHKISMKRHKKV